MKTYDECLYAARALARDPGVVRKLGFPTRDDFDQAIASLAEIIQRDDEPFYRSYGRAMDLEEGRALYAAREFAALPEVELIRKREGPEPLSPAEEAIAVEVRKYMADHPREIPERAYTKVLDANPDLYRAYMREDPAERWRKMSGAEVI